VGWLARQGKVLTVSPWVFFALLAALISWLTIAPRLGGLDFMSNLASIFSSNLILVLMILIIASVAQRDIVGKSTGFAAPWLVRLGEVSFAFYLVHATVMYIFIDFFGQKSTGWGNIIWYPLVLGVGVVLAFLLHNWVEKPFETKFRAFSKRY